MKKHYEKPHSEVIEIKQVLMNTVSGEQSQSGIKDGEGGDDLSRDLSEDLFEM